MSEWVKIHLKPQLEICIQMGKNPFEGILIYFLPFSFLMEILFSHVSRKSIFGVSSFQHHKSKLFAPSSKDLYNSGAAHKHAIKEQKLDLYILRARCHI